MTRRPDHTAAGAPSALSASGDRDARRRPIVLAAGGTGGHVVPALAVGEALHARGWDVRLITDARSSALPGDPRAWATEVLDGGRMTGGAVTKALATVKLLRNTARARALFKRIDPALVIGFGGYPALAALLSARTLKIPYMMHEQNAVLGRVNRTMARGAAAIALSFPDTARVPATAAARTVTTGLPLRRTVLDHARGAPSPGGRPDRVRLLVVGGSQGARILSTVVPDAIARLTEAERGRLALTQQCRPEDLDRVAERYAGLGLAETPDLARYFTDLPGRMAEADLVIARAGASTVAEIAALGRPSVLVPLAIATDDHQNANARALADAGAAEVMTERAFTPEALADHLKAVLAAPERLAAAGAAARAHACPQATEAVADLAVRLASGTATTAAGKAAREEAKETDQ
ncbi:undecaprenyldiphospho-muramoylpentapeptide beta-N-acetylglucosaminyltransferase [Rhodothalassium salexigens]|uniref:undecaprenyldiphospho-muramoylpentapeptide beta-N-acetylglucosaminyltransferase n=1 Tax=Rhodothalassium salexigens TaxID=1086 RepID=UPI001913E0B5|nr:undecaprenyldiphospho-muramoylpentapeptide beta-N-acetylglucosaminyltransferase [Rhodothalassium salexigens]MBK5911707.1 undecaprenyldiphospho-muramoylpentapeptide beta-N-acetylglucosaminyltransferase [Rhodothalassium salexigens]